jgi:DegV family protein with EDD domain
MPSIAIITDSTAYLPPEYIQKYHLKIAPLTVLFGEESYRDGIDISPREFYDRLKTSTIMPTTSQVTIGAFKDLYEDLFQAGAETLVITISGKLSGTVESARQARQFVPEAKIEVVDSLSTTVEQGLIVLAVARAAASGASLMECKQVTEQARQRTGVVFAVDTLEFLHRGGRIGGAKRFMGTLLNIKPILTINAGQVDALEQARTRKKSISRLVDIVAERVAGKSQVRLGVSHANALEEAQALMGMASMRLDPVGAMITDLSPVIGSHVGPGTVALAYYYEA